MYCAFNIDFGLMIGYLYYWILGRSKTFAPKIFNNVVLEKFQNISWCCLGLGSSRQVFSGRAKVENIYEVGVGDLGKTPNPFLAEIESLEGVGSP